MLEHVACYLLNALLVIHHQYPGFAHGFYLLLLILLRCGFLRGSGQVDVKGRAGAKLRFHADMAAVLVRYGEGCGESQPIALVLGCEKGVEYLFQVIFGYPDTVISYGDPDVIPFLERQCLAQVLRLAEVNIFSAYFYASAGGHGLLSVDD